MPAATAQLHRDSSHPVRASRLRPAPSGDRPPVRTPSADCAGQRVRTSRPAGAGQVRNEGIIFAIMAIFFTIVTPVYWLLSYEPAGTAALALTAAMSALIAFYVLFTARRLPGLRPEDRTDAQIEEGA